MKLSRLDGMYWEGLIEFLDKNRHALALESGYELEVAKAAEEYGMEAGAAVAVACRFLQVYGPVKTAWRAVAIYDELSPKNELIRGVKEGLSWCSPPGTLSKWTIKPMHPDNKAQRAGLANVMFAVAADELERGSTTEKVAAASLLEFLETGMKKFKENEVTDSA